MGHLQWGRINFPACKNLKNWFFRSGYLSWRNRLKLRLSTPLISCVNSRSLSPFRQLKCPLRKNQFFRFFQVGKLIRPPIGGGENCKHCKHFSSRFQIWQNVYTCKHFFTRVNIFGNRKNGFKIRFSDVYISLKMFTFVNIFRKM